MSVFSLSNLKKTWYYLQKNGIRNAVWAVLERIGQEQEVYTWQEPDEKTLSFQREHSASLRISIVVPAYRTKKEHLEAMLNSVSSQHIPTQTVSEDAKTRTIAMYAPTKTFNLAGLIGSYHIVYNPYLRDRMDKQTRISAGRSTAKNLPT